MGATERVEGRLHAREWLYRPGAVHVVVRSQLGEHRCHGPI